MIASYPRRQQLRRLRRAASHGALAAVALAGAVLAAGSDTPIVTLALFSLSGTLTLASRRALRLASRSRVGAESETAVRRALEQLAREGWSVRHAIRWQGGGDLDHVLRAPSGIGFVIETKTLRWSRAHLLRTHEAARSLGRRRRRYPSGVLAVLCSTRSRHLERVEGDVLVVSLDRLLPALRHAAAVGPHSFARSATALAR